MRWALVAMCCVAGLLQAAQAEPPRPDYATSQAWLAHGGNDGVALFYIHPTTYGGEAWNAAFDETSAQSGLADILETHVGAFRRCCAVWAPRYRQAALRAVFDVSGQGEAAYALAYEDVRAAFTRFLSELGERPFALAGHSQGSFHLRRLLEDIVVPDAELRERLVVAYVIGIGVPQASFMPGEALHPLAPCREAADIHCVVSWNSFTDDVGAQAFAGVQAARYADLIARTGEAGFVCVNPLSGRADEIAMPARSHPGAWMPGAPAPLPAVTGLACQGGALVAIDELPPPWLESAFAGGNLHMLDYRLTFSALQRDVAMRIAAWHDVTD